MPRAVQHLAYSNINTSPYAQPPQKVSRTKLKDPAPYPSDAPAWPTQIASSHLQMTEPAAAPHATRMAARGRISNTPAMSNDIAEDARLMAQRQLVASLDAFLIEVSTNADRARNGRSNRRAYRRVLNIVDRTRGALAGERQHAFLRRYGFEMDYLDGRKQTFTGCHLKLLDTLADLGVLELDRLSAIVDDPSVRATMGWGKRSVTSRAKELRTVATASSRFFSLLRLANCLSSSFRNKGQCDPIIRKLNDLITNKRYDIDALSRSLLGPDQPLSQLGFPLDYCWQSFVDIIHQHPETLTQQIEQLNHLAALGYCAPSADFFDIEAFCGLAPAQQTAYIAFLRALRKKLPKDCVTTGRILQACLEYPEQWTHHTLQSIQQMMATLDHTRLRFADAPKIGVGSKSMIVDHVVAQSLARNEAKRELFAQQVQQFWSLSWHYTRAFDLPRVDPSIEIQFLLMSDEGMKIILDVIGLLGPQHHRHLNTQAMYVLFTTVLCNQADNLVEALQYYLDLHVDAMRTHTENTAVLAALAETDILSIIRHPPATRVPHAVALADLLTADQHDGADPTENDPNNLENVMQASSIQRVKESLLALDKTFPTRDSTAALLDEIRQHIQRFRIAAMPREIEVFMRTRGGATELDNAKRTLDEPRQADDFSDAISMNDCYALGTQTMGLADITALVWWAIKRYAAPNNSQSQTVADQDLMRFNLLKALSQCIEDDGHRVCPVGIVQRLALSLQGFYPSLIRIDDDSLLDLDQKIEPPSALEFFKQQALSFHESLQPSHEPSAQQMSSFVETILAQSIELFGRTSAAHLDLTDMVRKHMHLTYNYEIGA